MNEPRVNDKNARPADGDMRDQLEVLRLMEQYRSQEEPQSKPTVPLAPHEEKPTAVPEKKPQKKKTNTESAGARD